VGADGLTPLTFKSWIAAQQDNECVNMFLLSAGLAFLASSDFFRS
jgi:hypothetical protein